MTITLYPENKIIPQIPRIVKLISLIKDHFDNHPEKVLSIFGNIYTMEFLSLYAELKKYSDFKGYTPNS